MNAPILQIKIDLTLSQAEDLQFALEDLLGKLLEEASHTSESHGVQSVEDHLFDYMQAVNIARHEVKRQVKNRRHDQRVENDQRASKTMDCIRCGATVPLVKNANLCTKCIPIEFPNR